MKNEKTFDYLFSSLTDAIIVVTLLVSIGQYVSRYYFIYIIFFIIVLLIGIEGYKLLTNQKEGYKLLTNQNTSSIPLKCIEEPTKVVAPKRKKRCRKTSNFQSKIEREHSAGSALSSKWDAIRKCVKDEVPCESDHETKTDDAVHHISNDGEGTTSVPSSSTNTKAFSRSRKLKKNIRQYVMKRTLNLYARSKLRLAAEKRN